MTIPFTTDPNSVMGKDRAPAVIAGVKTIWWVAMGVLLVILAAQADPMLGGGLLIVIVIGMVWAAHERKDALGHPLI